ncbi:MAG: InlB B-repeat-containing protein [Clostridia bacterium]|nr:InlB B-repeat-containing protein [Clostridia bacterium]
MKKLLIVLLLASSLLSLFACGKEPVMYDLVGGMMTATLTEDADLADVVATVPTKEGFVFAGWYSDAAYTDYINSRSITKAQKNANRAFAKWITVAESTEYAVRSDVVTITDGGRQKQRLDQILISDDYNITDLKRAGYSSLKIKVAMDICEVDDGYQHIFLYKNENCISEDTSLSDVIDKYVTGDTEKDPNLLYEHKYEHVPSEVDTNWSEISFETTVQLDKLERDLYLRYDASGNKEDDWLNKNVVVTITPIK